MSKRVSLASARRELVAALEMADRVAGCAEPQPCRLGHAECSEMLGG